MATNDQNNTWVGIVDQLAMFTALMVKADDLQSMFRSWSFCLQDHLPIELRLQKIRLRNQAVVESIYKDDQMIVQTVSFNSLSPSNRLTFINNQIRVDELKLATEESMALISIPIIEGELAALIHLKKKCGPTEVTRPFIYSWKNLMQIWLKAHPEVLDYTDETINGSKIDELTSRQKIIFQMMMDGSTNNEIAEAIGYSESLVKAESVIIFKTLNLSGRKDQTFLSYASKSPK